MTALRPWFERTFEFELGDDRFPELLERLRAAPDRVDTIVRGLPDEVLHRREDERWSILENIGHLTDLERLFMGRLDDFEAGLTTLRSADLENRATREAGHQEKSARVLIDAFRAARGRTLARIAGFPTSVLATVSAHPRLAKPMRIVDMMLFHAEHDDQHIARIHELVALPGGVRG